MVCFKLLVLIALATYVSGEPLLDLLGKVLGNSGGDVKSDDELSKALGIVSPVGQGQGLLAALGDLAGGINNIVGGNVVDILRDLSHIKIPGTVDDVVNVVVSVGRAVGGIIDSLIPGLGVVLGNLVIAIAKILICVLGSPGLTGSLLQDRRGGFGNTIDIPRVCRPDYGKKYGWKGYNGPYNNSKEILSYYDLKNPRSQVQDAIDKYTKGKGIDSLTGTPKLVCQSSLDLADIASKNQASWTNDDFITAVVKVATIIGSVGNNYKPGLGVNIVNGILIFVDESCKNTKYPAVSPYKEDILNAINNIPQDNLNGALNCKNKSNEDNPIQSNDDDNIQSNGGNPIQSDDCDPIQSNGGNPIQSNDGNNDGANDN